MSPRPSGPEPLTRARIEEIDRATPDWKTLSAESDFGPRSHARVLLEHIAYLQNQMNRLVAMYRAYRPGLTTGGMDCIRSYEQMNAFPVRVNGWGSSRSWGWAPAREARRKGMRASWRHQVVCR